MRHAPILAFAAFASLSLGACFRPGSGSVDAVDAGAAAGTGGAAGSTAGTGGRLDGPPDPGGPGDEPAPVVECGSQLCRSPGPSSMFGVNVEGCCSPLERCSLRAVGAECVDLGDSDPLCGAVDIGGSELPGCCVGGLCGVRLDAVSIGCIGPGTLEMFGLQPEFRECFGVASSVDAGVDASADDAGR